MRCVAEPDRAGLGATANITVVATTLAQKPRSRNRTRPATETLEGIT
jgi:hypothetical protein